MSRTLIRRSLILLGVFLGAYYLPRVDEYWARREASADAKQLLAQIRLVPDMVTEVDPGTGKPWIFLSGNYEDKHASLQARFRSNVSAAEACDDILRYFKRHADWNAKTDAGECDVRRLSDDPHLVSGFTALRKYPDRPNQFFLVSVRTREYLKPVPSGYPRYKTNITIDITRALNAAKFEQCTDVQLPGDDTCGAWIEY
jgi:hypothetical protein